MKQTKIREKSLTCHKDCELVELYTKRNFRCDCGNSKYRVGCELNSNKEKQNDKNIYGQNFRGLYCVCSRPYPDPDCPPELEGDEMIQCIVCEDWFHGTCLKIPKELLEREDTGELICAQCIETKPLLQYYDMTNNLTEQVSEKCKRPKGKTAKRETHSDSGVFVAESFRQDLCQCDDCHITLTELNLLFLAVPGDSMEDYESKGKEIIDAEKSAADKQINTLLDQLDYRGQQEIAYGLSTMKNAMSSMLQAVQAGEEVTTDHIEIFKRKLAEDMEQRKRRRLDP